MQFRQRICQCLGGIESYETTQLSRGDIHDFIEEWFTNLPSLGKDFYQRATEVPSLMSLLNRDPFTLGVACYTCERYGLKSVTHTYPQCYQKMFRAWVNYTHIPQGDYRRINRVAFYRRLVKLVPLGATTLAPNKIHLPATFLLGYPPSFDFYQEVHNHGLFSCMSDSLAPWSYWSVASVQYINILQGGSF